MRQPWIYPRTIIISRYGGTYSGAEWLAFYMMPQDVPEEALGGDVECAEFFADYEDGKFDFYIGKAEDPESALEELNRLYREDPDNLLNKTEDTA